MVKKYKTLKTIDPKKFIKREVKFTFQTANKENPAKAGSSFHHKIIFTLFFVFIFSFVFK